MKKIYLDYAAATPLDTTVLAAMEPYFSEYFYNPSATYLRGRDTKVALEEARTSVAVTLGTKKSEIIFTSGATEANNLAVQGIMRNFPGGEVLVSAIEHESVLEPAKLFRHREIPVSPQGIVDKHKLEKMISTKTALVSIMMVNNELGSVQPIHEISKIIGKLRKLRGPKEFPLYLHTDAVQAGNFLDLHVARLGIDMMSLSGGKLYGPRQSGALFVKSNVKLLPLILGGGQEGGLRAGTENVAGAVGLAKALETAQASRTEEAARLTKLRKLFATLLQKNIKSSVINGSSKHCAPHLLSVTIPNFDNERLMMELDEGGVIAAVGSACSSSSEKPSQVLAAIGLSKAEAEATLRFSLGRGSSKNDILFTVNLLAGLTTQHR